MRGRSSLIRWDTGAEYGYVLAGVLCRRCYVADEKNNGGSKRLKYMDGEDLVAIYGKLLSFV